MLTASQATLHCVPRADNRASCFTARECLHPAQAACARRGNHSRACRHRVRGAQSYAVDSTSDTAQTQQQQSYRVRHPDDAHSRWWEDWQHPCKCRVHYWQRGTSGPPIVLLHGFGVGCFHFDGLMQQLHEEHRLYALDFVGQGRSWPERPKGLAYSVDVWTRQVCDFIRSEIGEPVYLAGNSLGGFVAASVATHYPELCRGVVFLNATPWWAFNKPTGEIAAKVVTAGGGVVGQAAVAAADTVGNVAAAGASPPAESSGRPSDAELNDSREWSGAGSTGSGSAHSGNSTALGFGSADSSSNSRAVVGFGSADSGWLWSGSVPAPGWVRKVGQGIWDYLRNADTIQKTLQQVYARPHLADKALAERILEAADNPLAFDAFLSILFAPQASAGSFDEMLRSIQRHKLPILLIYGKEDPWVRTIWGQRIVRVVPEAAFYQVSPGGHCPQAEAPELVARCLRAWIQHTSHGTEPLLQVGEEIIDSDGVLLRRSDDSPTNALEWIIYTVYRFTTSVQRATSAVFR